MLKQWTTFRNSRFKYIFHVLSEEEHKSLLPLLEHKEVDIKFPFNVKNIQLFGAVANLGDEDRVEYFRNTPPHDYEGKPYGIRNSLMHFKFVMGELGRPQYGAIVKESLTRAEKMGWAIELSNLKEEDE